ncbi:MAG: peptidoglycan editing factor PgeF [Nitrospirae bacterium]|nr:peptidoglycan editing factor PgeF [Nitrospirota bacterium]
MAGKQLTSPPAAPGTSVSQPIGQIEGKNGVTLPPLTMDGGAAHFFTLKAGAARQAPAVQAVPPEMGRFVSVRQVHGNTVFEADFPGGSWSDFIRAAAESSADALITDRRGVGLAVVTADCVPVLLYDPVRRIIGAVHAGWRGTVEGVLSKTVAKMVEKFQSDPVDIRAGLGPAIGPCCYEVGPEVVRRLKESPWEQWESCLHPRDGDKGVLDLIALNRLQLLHGGIISGNIHRSDLCTACRPDLFYSYRRDGIGTGRMVSGIILQE